MKNIVLQRFKSDKVTFGKLLLDWIPEHKDIYTIELPWLNNKNNISCIPQGLYNCSRYKHPEKGWVWRVLNVPGREKILIHSGNFASDVKLLSSAHSTDTEGCILPGLGIEEKVPMVIKSKLAMAYLYKCIGDDNFTLEVKDA